MFHFQDYQPLQITMPLERVNSHCADQYRSQYFSFFLSPCSQLYCQIGQVQYHIPPRTSCHFIQHDQITALSSMELRCLYDEVPQQFRPPMFRLNQTMLPLLLILSKHLSSGHLYMARSLISHPTKSTCGRHTLFLDVCLHLIRTQRFILPVPQNRLPKLGY